MAIQNVDFLHAKIRATRAKPIKKLSPSGNLGSKTVLDIAGDRSKECVALRIR